MVIRRDSRSCVYVTRIPQNATDQQIKSALSAFGAVKKLYFDKAKPRGSVICEYRAPWSAEYALGLGGAEVHVAGDRERVAIKIKRYRDAGRPLPSDRVCAASSFEAAAEALVADIGVAPADQQAARDIAAQMGAAVEANAGDVHLLGSMATRLGLKGGDIDVTITTELSPDEALLRIQAVWPRAHVVPSRRCPVVRAAVNGRQVDVTLNNTYAVRNTALLAGYAAQAPAVVELVVLVKAWARACGVAVSGYALSVMAIAYLERAGMLSHWQSGSGMPHLDAATARGFFAEYGYRWNYAVQAVALGPRGVVPHAGLAWGRMCVQDPVEHAHNIAGAATAAAVDRMVHAMRSAADLLAPQCPQAQAVYSLAVAPRPRALWCIDRGPGHPTPAHVWAALGDLDLDLHSTDPDPGPGPGPGMAVAMARRIKGEGYAGLVRCTEASTKVWCELMDGSNDAMAPGVHALAARLNGTAAPVTT